MKYYYYENVNHMDGRLNGFGIWAAPSVNTVVTQYYTDLEEEGDMLHVLRLYEISKDEYDAWPHTCPDRSQIVYDDYGVEEDED